MSDQQPLPVIRVQLKAVKPAFPLPYNLTEFAVLRHPDSTPNAPGLGERKTPEGVTCFLDIVNMDEASSMPYAINIVQATRIASTCAISIDSYVLPNDSVIEGFDDGPHWGHYDHSLIADCAAWVGQHLEQLRPYLIADSYSRVANAMRLYGAALDTTNSDLALLGFVGGIESLFSIAPQELSFRLSLMLAKFLGKTVDEQQQFFGRAKELYSIRSKIAHGDRIGASEEAAAIQVTEHWTPEAEELARMGLKHVIDNNLIDVFNSPKDHESFLTDLLFR